VDALLLVCASSPTTYYKIKGSLGTQYYGLNLQFGSIHQQHHVSQYPNEQVCGDHPYARQHLDVEHDTLIGE